jgi:hypothetical protein
MEDLIVKQEGYDDFYVFAFRCGSTNPAELLMKKVDTLFSYFKTQYDYIIVDTAPVSLVADTLLIANMRMFTICGSRQLLEKRMLNINNLYKKTKITKHVSAS